VLDCHVPGSPGQTASFLSDKISRQIKTPYLLILKSHHSSFYVLCSDEGKETLPSGHHHPHPGRCQMKVQAKAQHKLI